MGNTGAVVVTSVGVRTERYKCDEGRVRSGLGK